MPCNECRTRVVSMGGKTKNYKLQLLLGLEDFCRPFTNNHTWRHRIAGCHARHDGSIGDTKAIDAVNLQLSIDYRHRITAHFGGAGLMPVRTKSVAKELLQFWFAHRTGRHFASRERPQGRRISELASQAQSGYKFFQVLRIAQKICVN